MTRNQIMREEHVERVFDQIDWNKSGTIELDELNLIFTKYGIELTRQELCTLFNHVDADSSGTLSLNEFKTFALDPKAQQFFKAFIMRARQKHEMRFGKGRVKGYLPFCVTRLLEHLSFLGRRESIQQNIAANTIDGDNPHNPLNQMQNFIKLFLLNEENADKSTISPEYENTILGRILSNNNAPQKKASTTMVSSATMSPK